MTHSTWMGREGPYRYALDQEGQDGASIAMRLPLIADVSRANR